MKFIRSNIGFMLSLIFLLSVLLIPEFKAILLTGLLKTGLYNPGISQNTDAASIKGERLPLISPARFISSTGEVLNLREAKGKVIFLNFWATWCPPCLAEMPSIQLLKNKLENSEAVIFAMVDVDSNLPEASAFMSKNRYDFPIYRQFSAIPEELFDGTLPTTLIIDQLGQIVFRHEGLGNYDTPAMLNLINSLTR